MQEYDCGDQYFCTLNAPPRPKCGSSYMDNERHDIYNKDEKIWRKQMREWDKWSINRQVKAWGICDDFNKRRDNFRQDS